MKPCTPVLIIFLLIIIWQAGLTYAQISNNESNALKALYEKTGGRNWFHQENWKEAPGTENTWYGITCDPANTTVLKIELSGDNLQGVLPADMDAFSNLTTLDISGNDYTAESYTVISGKVTYNGKGVGGVTLKFTGENDAVTTDESGNYKKEVPYNWSGSVTPIKDRHQFKPKEKKYTKVTSRHEGQNYEVQLPKIFGKVKNFWGKGISGIKFKSSDKHPPTSRSQSPPSIPHDPAALWQL
jgi:hypothetical protein